MINSSPNEGLEICSFEVFPGRIWGIKSLLIQWAVWFPLSPGSQGWLDALWDCWICSSSCGALEKVGAIDFSDMCIQHTGLHYIFQNIPSHPIPSYPYIYIYYCIYSLFPEVGPFAHPGPSPFFAIAWGYGPNSWTEVSCRDGSERVAWAQANPVDMGLGRHGRYDWG